MLIKICGLTDPKTAYATAQKGADFIGLLFSKKSVRYVDLSLAKEIATAAREGGAEIVGVFVDESLEQLLKITRELGLKIVQLHGPVREFCDCLPQDLQIIYVADGLPLPPTLDPKKDFLLFEKTAIKGTGCQTPGRGKHENFRFFIAGGLKPDTVGSHIQEHSPHGVDVSSGVESMLRIKDLQKISAFIQQARPGRFGSFGGKNVPELLIEPLKELERAYATIGASLAFREELSSLLCHYAGRPTALTEAAQFAKHCGEVRIFLKREDLLHTGAHKINNAIGQCLLAKRMGKTRIIAETGAGQHGVATATACALLGLECVVYMGTIDMARQAPNVLKMRLLGARVAPVAGGSATLKDAVNEALRDWAESYETTHYCLGSALGPHPFPTMVADFQSVIGKEAKEQFFQRVAAHPHLAIACVGGGSNAIGLFGAYLDDPNVALIGVEGGGKSTKLGENAARFGQGSIGILHGTTTYVLQTKEGQIASTHSISAGLDYPAVGPQHADLFQKGRVHYDSVTDDEALRAFYLLSKTEGIIPALESAHALAYALRIGPTLPKGTRILINLSGRGDKDLQEIDHVQD